MDKCPFCGADSYKTESIYFWFKCGTNINLSAEKHYKIERSNLCYKTKLAVLQEKLASETLSYQSLADHAEVHERELTAEIAALKGLLRQAMEVVRHYAAWYTMRSTPRQLAVMIDKAQALLPDIEAALKEK